MKATRIFSLFVCIIILYGITNAGEKKLVNVDVPLPDDTKIIAPAEGVPKKIAAFSGAWEGRWAYYGADAALIVESINSKNVQRCGCHNIRYRVWHFQKKSLENLRSIFHHKRCGKRNGPGYEYRL